MMGITTLPNADPFSLAFGSRKLNFLDEARRNSLLLVAHQNGQSVADDLLSPIDIEWDLMPEIVVSSHVLTAANITDVESSDSSVCTASTDIFDDDGQHHDATDLAMPKSIVCPTSECEPILDDSTLSTQAHRFKPFHEEKWSIRYRELQIFHREHGHVAVPHTYPRNQQLARWIKR